MEQLTATPPRLKTVIDALLFWLVVARDRARGAPARGARCSGGCRVAGSSFARPLGLLVAAYPGLAAREPARRSLRPCGRRSPHSLGSALAGALLWRRGLGRPRRGRGALALARRARLSSPSPSPAAPLLRSFAPDVWQTEKPMDMAFVNAVGRADSFPPHDPWQAGSDVNYYYFGHYLVAFLVRATGVDPAVGFNLGRRPLLRARRRRRSSALAATLYLALRAPERRRSVAVAGRRRRSPARPSPRSLGNLAGGVQLLRRHRPPRHVRLVVAVARDRRDRERVPGLQLPARRPARARARRRRSRSSSVAYAVQLALRGPPRLRAGRRACARPPSCCSRRSLLGALYATNSFDFPTACALGVGALLLWALEAARPLARRAAAWGAALARRVGARSSSRSGSASRRRRDGLGVVREHAQLQPLRARLRSHLRAPALGRCCALREPVPRAALATSSGAAPSPCSCSSCSRPSGSRAARRARSRRGRRVRRRSRAGRSARPTASLWLLAAVALGPARERRDRLRARRRSTARPSFRFNTVFKTGYQAWFLLAVVAGVGVSGARAGSGRRVRRAWLGGLAALVALALVYPRRRVVLALGRLRARRRRLDGLRWLSERAPDDAAAIEWLRAVGRRRADAARDCRARLRPRGPRAASRPSPASPP